MKDQFIIKHGALEKAGGTEEDLLGILNMDLSKALKIEEIDTAQNVKERYLKIF